MYQNMLKYAEIRKRMEKRAPFDTRIQPPSFAKVGVCRHKATGKWQRRGEKQSFDPWRSSSRRIIATIYGRLTWLTFRFPVYGSKFQTLPGHGDTGAGFWRKSHTRINFWRYEFETAELELQQLFHISVLPVSFITKAVLLSYEPRHVHYISLSHLGPIYFVTRNCPKQSTFSRQPWRFGKNNWKMQDKARPWPGLG